MAFQSRGSWVVVLGSILAGVLLNRAALRAPLVLDDYAQRAMIEGTLTPPRSPLNLYDFVSDSNRSALLARGAIPLIGPKPAAGPVVGTPLSPPDVDKV